jgi:DNA excision repair protein ERCC-2
VAARVSLAQRHVACSVNDLLPEAPRFGLGPPGEGLARLSVGAELHRIVQGERLSADPHGSAEVPVAATVTLDGWTLKITGRVDAMSLPPGALPVVEEIKTLHFRSELPHPSAQDRLERFRWQVRLYAFCLFPDGGARACLRLVDLGGEQQRVEDVPWSPEQVRAYLRGRLHAFVAVESERERVRERWRAAAAELRFPFPTVRPVQDQALAAVEESLAAGRCLLLAAPTGVGKTAAALYPALKLALASGHRVAFLTAKTLQQQLAVETLGAMQQGGWRSLQVRAKARMCANREVICHEEFCEHARDYTVKLAEHGVLAALRSGPDHFDPDRIFATAHAATVCPFEAALELLDDCTAVVCDVNYVFDPSIGLFGLAEEGALADTYLIIDEAHNLVDRAREYYSPRLTRPALAEARALLAGRRQRVCRELTEVFRELDGIIAELAENELGARLGAAEATPELERLVAARMRLDALIAPYFTFKRNADLWLAHDPVLDVLLTLARLTSLLEDAGPEFVTLVERSGRAGDECLRVLCLDASRFTGTVLRRCAGAVAMSATLEPFEFYQELLGFEPDRTDTLALPSPFPPENRLVLVVDEVDTSYRQRARAYGRVAELVAELAPAGRNALALFPSYAFLQEVANRLVVPGHRVELQRGDDSEAVRREMLARLRTGDEPVLLLAVLGGVFAEGVDYPGEMLSQVVVVSPALPQVGPERELLKRYFDSRYERGFEYAYLIPGMTRVIQAAGRLIRSAEDRGVIALICRRFLRAPYVALLPGDWTGGEPRQLRCTDPGAAVRAFFDRQQELC